MVNPFPAGLVSRLAFDEFDAMAAAGQCWQQDYLKLTPGPFHGSYDMAHTGRVQLATASWSGGIRTQGANPRGARTFCIVLGDGIPARHRGVAVRADELVTLSDRDELHFLHPRGCLMVLLSMEHTRLDEMAVTFLGDGWDDSIGAASVLRLHDVAGAATELRRWLDLCTSEPARLADSSFAAALERDAAAAILRRLDLPVRRVRAAARRPLALRAGDYLDANRARAVTIAELCAAVGVPERSLYAIFREHFGLPPIAYLRAMRLHGARGQLRERGTATTVTQTALDWGFYHFGEFAAAYRRLFGEAPSHTMRGTYPTAGAS